MAFSARRTRELALAIVLALAPWRASAQAAPSLIDLYRQAIATHPALMAQQAATDRAEARHDQARSRLLPQASALLNNSYNNFHGDIAPADEYPSYRQALTLRQPLLDLASWRQADAEQLRIGQTRHEFEATRSDLAAELVERVLDVLDASEEVVVLQAEKEAVAGQRARLRQMVERQMAKVTELLETEAYYVTLEAREIDARNAVQIALERLRQETGVEVSALQTLTSDALPEVPGTMDEWVRRALEGSPRLAAVRMSVEAEQSSVSGARAQHIPLIALTASKTWSDTNSDNRRNPPYNVATVGVQIAIPIYEGGRVDGAVREALSREMLARAQFEEARRTVEREVRSAWLKAQGDRLRIDATLQSSQAQAKARDAQRRGFELGIVTVVDLLETQRRLYRARADHARARHDYLRDLAGLHRHAGAFAETDIAMFSALFVAAPRSLR